MRSWTAFRWVLLIVLLGAFFPATSSADTVTVTVSRANVRAGMGTTHRVITTLAHGTTLPILETRQSWHQIRLDDGREGWIADSIVRVERGTRESPVVHTPPRQKTSWPKTLRNSIGIELVLIPAGKFMMGAMGNVPSDQQPVHQVLISRPFYLGKYEVTQAQWRTVMGNNPSFPHDPNPVRPQFADDSDHPVVGVGWEDVQQFIRRLNAQEGHRKYRLPTEAEWEYAARAGSTTAYSFGNNLSQLGEYAWCKESSRPNEKLSSRKAHPVGQLKPNAWGLYDIHGNVSEWVQDWYEEYSSELVTDPQGPASGTKRVNRGGSWFPWTVSCTSARRVRADPPFSDIYLGFRLLRTVP